MEPQPPKKISWKEILFLPIGCILQASIPLVLLSTSLFFLIIFFISNTSNTDFFGLTAPDLDSLIVSSDFTHISDNEGRTWTIDFESTLQVDHEGFIRHINPNHVISTPFITHDILITQGDYSDPDLVRTTVFNHYFFWFSSSNPHPSGGINLLHTVVFDQGIYNELLDLRTGMIVNLSGYEIAALNILDEYGNWNGAFIDTGCNTFLVTEVSILESP